MLRFLGTIPNPRALAAIYTSTLLSGAWAMLLPTIPVLSEHFGVSAGAAAQIVTAFSVGRFAGTVASGVIIDRIGTRMGVVGGPLAGSIAALLAAGTPWLPLILAWVAVMGIGDSLWANGREMAAIDLACKSQHGRIVSSLHGTHSVGLAICPLLGGMLTEALGFRAAFVAYGVSAAGAVLLGFNCPDSPPAHRAPASGGGNGGWGFRDQLQRLQKLRQLFHEVHPQLRSTYLVLVLATLAAQSQRITVQSMLPLYAGSYLNFSPTEVGLLFSISGIFVFAMILPAGFVMDKVGRKWATVPSTGIPALVFLAIPFTHSFPPLAFLVSLAGLSNGLSLGSLATSTYDVAPVHVRARLQAARRTVAVIGGIFAPLVGGYLANTFNPGVPFLVYAPLLLVSATLLAVIGKETFERRV
jgi:MFS family permease